MNPAARHVPRPGDHVEISLPLFRDELRDRARVMAEVRVHYDDELACGVRQAVNVRRAQTQLARPRAE